MSEALAVRGSIQDRAKNKAVTLADAIMEVEAIVLVDTSGSMRDGGGPRGTGSTKYSLACKELERIQNQYPGKVAVVSWSDTVEFCPSGVPTFLESGTAMDCALNYVLEADGLVNIILISDGLPDDEHGTLEIAKQFSSGINTVYIGPEGSEGAKFLKQVSKVSGGKYGGAREVMQLGQAIKLLMAKPED